MDGRDPRKARRLIYFGLNIVFVKVELDENLAYEVGVHIGDGNLYRYMSRIYRTTYAGNAVNESCYYRQVLCPLLQSIYDATPRLYVQKRRRCVILVLNSKEVFHFKSKELGLPVGKKTNIAIPQQIREDRKLLLACLRGVGDTDFGLSFKRTREGLWNEPRLELYSQSLKLIHQISEHLQEMGITVSCYSDKRRGHVGFRLVAYGKINLLKWVRDIGFTNPWHLVRIEMWKMFGSVPPNQTFDDYLRAVSRRSSQQKALLQPVAGVWTDVQSVAGSRRSPSLRGRGEATM